MIEESAVGAPHQLTAPSIWERRFAILVLVMSTGAFLNIPGDFTGQQLDSGQGLWFMQLFWGAAYVITLSLILRQCPVALGVLLRQPWIVALLLLPFFSAGWSEVPALTLRKASALAATTAFGSYFAVRYRPSLQLSLLASASFIIIGFSIAFRLLGIGHSVNTPDSGWIGVFVHRNAFGRVMVLSSAVFLSYAGLGAKQKRLGYLGLTLSFVLIFLSTSKGPLIYAVVLLLTFVYFSKLRTPERVTSVLRSLLWAGAVVAVISYLVIQHFDAITAALGLDPNMTGRIPMWIFSSVFALQRPWFGYGYNAFWRGADGPSVGIWQLLSWPAPHAHNGLLNLWLDLGLVGVSIFLVGFVLAIVRSVRYLRVHKEPAVALWPASFLVFFFLSNLTESSMVDPNTISWIVYVSVFITLFQATHKVATSPGAIKKAQPPRPVLLSTSPRPLSTRLS